MRFERKTIKTAKSSRNRGTLRTQHSDKNSRGNLFLVYSHNGMLISTTIVFSFVSLVSRNHVLWISYLFLAYQSDLKKKGLAQTNTSNSLKQFICSAAQQELVHESYMILKLTGRDT